MAWLILWLAGLFECAWALGLKYAIAPVRLVPLLLTGLAMGASFGCLTFALRTLPVGSAYAVWTGIGAVGTAIGGIYLFEEAVTTWRLVSIGLVVAGIIGLKFAD